MYAKYFDGKLIPRRRLQQLSPAMSRYPQPRRGRSFKWLVHNILWIGFMLCRILTLSHRRDMEAAAILCIMYIRLWSLLSWITHSHMEHLPVHFIFNPGHVEYDLGVLFSSHDLPLASRQHRPLYLRAHELWISVFKLLCERLIGKFAWVF